MTYNKIGTEQFSCQEAYAYAAEKPVIRYANPH